MIRLNKFISQAGKASRREADRLITEGRIAVNGKVVQDLGYKIDEMKDRIVLNGEEIKKEQDLIYLIINKPVRYLVTLKDPFRRPIVTDLLPWLKKRVFPVGRLDYESEGLLLMTNDGELAHRLMHPRFRISRQYLVKIEGMLENSSLRKLERGIFLDGRKTGHSKILLRKRLKRTSLYDVEIREGRKREIRHMFEAVGHRVIALQRIRFANLSLSGLKPGQWRFLTKQESSDLRGIVNLNKGIS